MSRPRPHRKVRAARRLPPRRSSRNPASAQLRPSCCGQRSDPDLPQTQDWGLRNQHDPASSQSTHQLRNSLSSFRRLLTFRSLVHGCACSTPRPEPAHPCGSVYTTMASKPFRASPKQLECHPVEKPQNREKTGRRGFGQIRPEQNRPSIRRCVPVSCRFPMSSPGVTVHGRAKGADPLSRVDATSMAHRSDISLLFQP